MDLPALYLNLRTEVETLLRELKQSKRSRRPGPSAPPTVPRQRQEQRKLDPAEVAEVVARYDDLERAAVLARRFGVDVSTIRRALTREGVALRPRGRLLTDEQVAEARRLIGQGVSYLELGRRLGVTDQTVRNAVHRPSGGA